MATADTLAELAEGVKANSTVLGRIEEGIDSIADAADKTATAITKNTEQIGVLIDILRKNPQIVTNMTREVVSMFKNLEQGVSSLSKALNAGVTKAEKALTAKAAATSAQKSVDQANKARFPKTITMVASYLERFVEIAVENGYPEAAEFDLEDKTKYQEYAKKICSHSDKLSEILTNYRIAYNQEVNDRRTDNHTEERMTEPADIPEPKKPAAKKKTTRKPRKKAAPAPPPVEESPVEEVVDDEEKKAGDEVVEDSEAKAETEVESEETPEEATKEKPKKITKKAKTEKKPKVEKKPKKSRR